MTVALPAEKVELLVTVHAPTDAAVIAAVAAALANAVPGCRAEVVDGEGDLVFVRPVPEPATWTPWRPFPPYKPGDQVVTADGGLVTVTPPLIAVPDPPEAFLPAPYVGSGTLTPPDLPESAPVPEAPAEPAAGLDAPNPLAAARAKRLRAYLDLFDGWPVGDELAKMRTAHRTGRPWEDSQQVWHCPWCTREFSRINGASRHADRCHARPGGEADPVRQL